MNEIKKLLEQGKQLIGSDRTLKELRKGNVTKVYVSTNASKSLLEDLEYYKEIGGVELISLNMNSEELGTFCKKPFRISVIGALK